MTWTADHDATTVTVHTHVEGDYQPPWGAMDFALRPSDDRTIKVISELTPSASNQHPTVENTGRP